jgi:hypothetical protein
VRKSSWIAIVLVLVVLAAFIVLQFDRGVQEPGPALSSTSLRNMTYQSQGTRSEEVRVTDGKFEDAAGHVWVTMLDTVAWGDVIGDGQPEAVVVLGTNTGGSGVFHSLALVADVDGNPVNVAIAELGDRIKLKGLSIKNRGVIVEMITHGPSDPMCCPTMSVTRIYGYDGEALRMMEQIPPESESSDRSD